MTNSIDENLHPPDLADRSSPVAAPAKLEQAVEAILRPFARQSAYASSIVLVGQSRLWLGAAGSIGTATGAAAGRSAFFIRPAGRDKPIATYLQDIGCAPMPAAEPDIASGEEAGERLLVLFAQDLQHHLTLSPPVAGYRAVAVLSRRESAQRDDRFIAKLRRDLFDRGLVEIGCVRVASLDARCFLAADAVRDIRQTGTKSRGHIMMSTLGSNGAFANQLFQYAYLKLYALRHGLTVATPAWQGRRLFGLKDQPCADLRFPKLQFHGFSDEDRQLWEKDDPPINVDLWGYFQETPKCWREQRALLRKLFQLPEKHRKALDAWCMETTRGGKRTLVAVHVRRGDYRKIRLPWLRLVPEAWYVAWLRGIWPTLRDPILFVGTDEPDTILPAFSEFEVVSLTVNSGIRALPDYVRDFEVLKRADYLAICNSSFSRMAAILAPATQQCFLPSFEIESFAPYEPWLDGGFWSRFAADEDVSPATETDASKFARSDQLDGGYDESLLFSALESTTVAGKSQVEPDGSTQQKVYFDVSDLFFYLREHATLSGIQRVQCELLRNLFHFDEAEPFRLVVTEAGSSAVIDGAAFLRILARARFGPTPSLTGKLNALLRTSSPFFVRPNDLFIAIGAFWQVGGIGRLFQKLKNSGVIVGFYIHDIISITDPEYFNVRDTRIFVKGLVEALTFGDFVLTSSEYNRKALARHIADRRLRALPIELVPLAHEFPSSTPHGQASAIVAKIVETKYVLCVGTIEVRKNPAYLFNIWKRMIRDGRESIPTLVFAGRKGWLIQDFMEQLTACNYLDGKVVVLHDVSDGDLAILYQRCLLTIYPSFAEGWGLPVGESLAHGKVCIASGAGAIPEAGGDLADYINPYDVSEGLKRLVRYVDSPRMRRRREREIMRKFEPRSWRDVARNFLGAVRGLAQEVRPSEEAAAIRLPPNRYLPISSSPDQFPLPGADGELSADLICVSGWRPAEFGGVWADGAAASIRFRADAPAGTRIRLVMRITTASRERQILRISSGSGAEAEVTLSGGNDKMAVLPCAVESGDLVSAQLSLTDRKPRGRKPIYGPRWGLMGILYILPGAFGSGPPSLGADHRVEPQPAEPAAEATLPAVKRASTGAAPAGTRIQLLPASLNAGDRATTFGAFLHGANAYWPLESVTYRDAPIFVDQADKRAFWNSRADLVGRVNDEVRLIRRSDQYVSMSRFSEGTVFDRSGASKGFGYVASTSSVPWLSRDEDGLWIGEQWLNAAPRFEQSCLVFFNGNLHNYYHWMVEGMLSLDVVARVIGPASDILIVLPKSIDMNAVFDHRRSLPAVGLDGYRVVEVAADLIHVKEAIWADSGDFIKNMPADCIRDLQRRIAAKYSRFRGPRNKRLLVARRGPTRMIDNIGAVEGFLNQHGFETVYLEGMTVADQVMLFQQAEFIVGPHGAGLSNLLFCEPGTKVIEFMPIAEVRPFFWLISEKLDLIHGMQFCAAAAGEGFQASVTVDIGKLQKLYRMIDAYC